MVYVFLADGCEEIEALSPVDILRRAKIEVQTVGIGSHEVVGANGIKIVCDTEISKVSGNPDGVILPGGMPGAENLFKNEKVKDIINLCARNDKLIAAICASPMILGRLGILEGKKACCYPGFEKELKDAEVSNEHLCVDGKIITAKGPGVSLEFALKVVEVFVGSRVASDVRLSMQCI